MYTRCIHCCDDLGANESVEHFPVGRRLAFDAERGRLWAVCPHCSRWNLTPLEERWEAVEECERLFRGQRLRVQTSNIGLVALRDGTGLVRIGRPLRPEFAAWRYGREFTRRHTRNLLLVSAAGIAVTGVALGSLAIGAAAVLPQFGFVAFGALRMLMGPPIATELPRGPGRSWSVPLGSTMILPHEHEGWYLYVKHHFGHAELHGNEARRVLGSLLARTNRAGASGTLVTQAVSQLEQSSTDALLGDVAQRSLALWEVDGPKRRAFEQHLADDPFGANAQKPPVNRAGLSLLEPARRLALEMALHEHDEQRALDGEMAALEDAWREAEEIAGIADDLLLPPGTAEFIERNRPR